MQIRRCREGRFRIAAMRQKADAPPEEAECMGLRSCRRAPAVVALVALSMFIAPGGAMAPWVPLLLSGAEPVVAPDAPWPRRFQATDGSVVTMYEPQISSWNDRKKMELYAAVTHAPKGAEKPLVGTV